MITIKIVVVALPLQILQLETGISSLDLSKMKYHVQGVKFATGSLRTLWSGYFPILVVERVIGQCIMTFL